MTSKSKHIFLICIELHIFLCSPQSRFLRTPLSWVQVTSSEVFDISFSLMLPASYKLKGIIIIIFAASFSLSASKNTRTCAPSRTKCIECTEVIARSNTRLGDWEADLTRQETDWNFEEFVTKWLDLENTVRQGCKCWSWWTSCKRWVWSLFLHSWGRLWEQLSTQTDIGKWHWEHIYG